MKQTLCLLTSICLLTMITSCFPRLEEGPLIRDEQKAFDMREEIEALYNLSTKDSESKVVKKRSFFRRSEEYSAEVKLEETEFVNRVIIEAESERAAKRYRAHRAALIESQKSKGLLYRNSSDFYSYGELSHYMEFYTKEARERPRLAIFTFRRGRVVYSMQIGGIKASETGNFEKLVKGQIKLLERELSSAF